MNETELQTFREKVAELATTGSEQDVRAYVDEHFPRLPEEMQNSIAAALFTSAMQDEAEELDVAGELEEDGLLVAEKLQEAKAELEAGK